MKPISGFLLVCKRGRRDPAKSCRVARVNADSRWHLDKMESKCKVTQSEHNNTCRLIFAYNNLTKRPIRVPR